MRDVDSNAGPAPRDAAESGWLQNKEARGAGGLENTPKRAAGKVRNILVAVRGKPQTRTPKPWRIC